MRRYRGAPDPDMGLLAQVGPAVTSTPANHPGQQRYVV
jgi:hypothetical protein